jgi:hypothetical protein
MALRAGQERYEPKAVVLLLAAGVSITNGCWLTGSFDELQPVADAGPADTGPAAPPPCPSCIEIEAESGTITSPMGVVSDAAASGGAAIQTTTPEGGTAVFHFNAPTSGNYRIWGRARVMEKLSDSFYVTMDLGNCTGCPEDIYDVPDSPTYAFSLIPVHEPDGRTPRVFVLSQGPHTLTFRGRELGTFLDKFIITSDVTFVPQGPVVAN